MFTLKTKTPTPTTLDLEIDRVHVYLGGITPNDPQYATISANLATLYKIKDTQSSDTLSADAMAGIFANLVGIGAILLHERTAVITTKALGYVVKAFR